MRSQLDLPIRSQLEHADEVQARARVGDLVLAATDGVLDNLFEHQLQARSDLPIRSPLELDNLIIKHTVFNL